jgi:EF hand
MTMLRTFAAAMLAATALAATLAVAQPQDAPAADRPAREPMTRTAVEQRAAAMFARMDADGDARLTPADRAARSGERQDSHFARLDADGNGAISREEFAARADQRAERREGAGEHRPGREHARMGGQRGPRGGAQRIMASADADGDGAVTQAEFASAMLARFDAADSNRNGTIEASERRGRGRPDRPATR